MYVRISSRRKNLSLRQSSRCGKLSTVQLQPNDYIATGMNVPEAVNRISTLYSQKFYKNKPTTTTTTTNTHTYDHHHTLSIEYIFAQRISTGKTMSLNNPCKTACALKLLSLLAKLFFTI